MKNYFLMEKTKKSPSTSRKKLKKNQWKNQRKKKQKHSGLENLKVNQVLLMSLELPKRIRLMLQQQKTLRKQFQIRINQKLQKELRRRKNLKKSIISKFFQNPFRFHLIVCNLKICWTVILQFGSFFRVFF
jgi:hypothetical protein